MENMTFSEWLQEVFSKDDKHLKTLVSESSDSEIADMLFNKTIELNDIAYLLSMTRLKSIGKILEPRIDQLEHLYTLIKE
ncbi:hypothetical protein [Dysgonomonas sp. ZJ709]|uniref:hypothetical protein n=1 Tax=Dysgonomonas sp. ZJ709 TaxID=2709797 RepID=UPI0013EA0D71|nr:hypothetical protein [Dysgonomonas sp. ZJ709]